MKILITGATGLVGKRLTELLLENGYSDLHALTRSKESAQSKSVLPITFHEWDLNKGFIENSAIENVDIVFNLAGENIADGRWTDQKKKRILNSRTAGPRLLLEKFNELNHFPKKFISSSAVGIYGSRGEEEVTVDSLLGDDYLADVCKQWENAVHLIKNERCNTYCLRTGVVLSDRDGALTKMLPAFKAGVAGKLGSGKQYMSWIHLDDLAAQFIFVMENDLTQVCFNAVAPNPVNNIEFTKVLGDTINRPTFLPVPAMALKILFGEMSCVLLEGQKALPTQLVKSGYSFKFPTIELALSDLLKKNKNNIKELLRYQFIDREPQEIFTFFSQAQNLEKLTPESMSFKMTHMSTPTIQEGSIIDYKLSVHGLPLKWKAKILEYVEGEYFIDEQLSGPYSQWIHKHAFIKARNGGTIVVDHVHYKIPMGFIGSLIAGPFIKKDISKIFKYRLEVLNKKFTTP